LSETTFLPYFMTAWCVFFYQSARVYFFTNGVYQDFHCSQHSHVGIGASKVAIKTCRKTNLAGTRAPPRNRVTNTKIIFVLARLRIAPLASDWPGTFQEFIEGYGGEMLEPTRPLST